MEKKQPRIMGAWEILAASIMCMVAIVACICGIAWWGYHLEATEPIITRCTEDLEVLFRRTEDSKAERLEAFNMCLARGGVK